MKQKLTAFIILSVACIMLGVVANAATYPGSYREPTVSAPGDNHELVPITEGALNQTKDGSLTTTTFNARAAAWIRTTTFITGYLRGENAAYAFTNPTADSTIKFGDATSAAAAVSVAATGRVSAKTTFQSDTLIPSASETMWNYVCADTTGTLVKCQDLCGNILGVQPTIPEGMEASGNDCVPSDAVGPTTGTTCQYQMLVRKIDSTHAKFTLQQNGGVYQYSPGAGADNKIYTTIQLDDSSIATVPAIRGQLASYTLPVATNHVAVLGVEPGIIGGGEVCWSGY